jgi:hypothetical protein
VDGVLNERSVSLAFRPSTSRQAVSGGNPTTFGIVADQYVVSPTILGGCELINQVAARRPPLCLEAFGRKRPPSVSVKTPSVGNAKQQPKAGRK